MILSYKSQLITLETIDWFVYDRKMSLNGLRLESLSERFTKVNLTELIQYVFHSIRT